MTWILLIVCTGFAIVRFYVPVHGINNADVFKDMAHLFVGGLFGAAIYATVAAWRISADIEQLEQLDHTNSDYTQAVRDYILILVAAHVHAKTMATQLWVMAVGLTVVEVVAFFTRG